MTRETKLYVGNLPPDSRERDLDDVFSKYGKIAFIDLKDRRGGPPFAFIEYDDPRDAEDAVRGRDGYDMDGYRLRVEFPKGQGPRGPGGRPMGGGRDGGRDGGGRFDRDREYGAGYGALGRPRGGGRRTSHRILVSGLPPTGSWQDLKDHMREAGDVCYTDVFKDGTGVVEFARADDVKYAVRKLDDSKFKSHEGETSYIRVTADSGSGRDRSRSPHRSGGGRGSPHARRSRSRSPHRSRSPRRSRSPASRSKSPKGRSPSRNGAWRDWITFTDRIHLEWSIGAILRRLEHSGFTWIGE